MAVRLSRRAGPDHPTLFDPSRAIPVPPRPPSLPAARAASDLAAFRAVLSAADAIAVAELSLSQQGRSVTVGGARLAADPLLPGDALLDDGTAVIPLVVVAEVSPAMRVTLSHRYLMASGTIASREGFLTLIAHELRDLRELDREWKALRRR